MSEKKVPSFQHRRVQMKQKAAKILQEQQAELAKATKEKEAAVLSESRFSTYSGLKTAKVRRREANQQAKNIFQENITRFLAEAVYDAAPIDKPQMGRNQVQVDRLRSLIQETFKTDSSVGSALGDAYARRVCSMGAPGANPASYLAGIMSGLNGGPYRDRPVATDIGGAGVGVHDIIQDLTTFGENDASTDKGEYWDDECCEAKKQLVEQVQTRVVQAVRKEAERLEMGKFLKESYAEDPYAKSSNRLLAAQTKERSVFREVCEAVASCHRLNENVGGEEVMTEAIMHYTLLETLQTVGLLGKSREDIINECSEIRKRNSKK
jgi:hypothetical protein